MTINVGLVGCGRIAVRHADLVGGGQIPGMRLQAVCDVQADRAEKFGRKYGVPTYSSMTQMMEAEPVNLAVVLTPSGMHADHVVALARFGKDVMTEKPMALRLDDASRMIRACEEARVRLFVVKQNRFNVPVLKLREALEQGRFGKLFLGTVRVRWSRTQAYYDQDAWRGTWRYDGGVLANQASHHIDLLEWMMGDITSLYAKSINAFAQTETEDTAVAVVKFSNGALGTIEATTAVRPKDLEGSISILGSGGSVEIGGFAVNRLRVWQFSDAREGDEDTLAKFSVNPPDVYGFGHRAYYHHVADCIENGAAQLVDGREGMKSLRVLTAMYESIETGREITLHFQPEKCRLGT
ncbi:MAG: Gfo/Idh/MocA family oxidoreductase [Betaproteobacteria bacterium]|nr:MAG: Gfo/Idh/MocA family oxidoreductase [Betaproteobacteria bacterium]